MIKKFDYYKFRFLWGDYVLIYVFLLIIFSLITMINLMQINHPLIPFLVFFSGWILPIILIYIIRKIVYQKNGVEQKIVIENKKIITPEKFGKKTISKNDIKSIELVTRISLISGFFGLAYLFAELVKSNNSYNFLIINLKNGEKIILSKRNLDISNFAKELYYIHFDELFEKKKEYSFLG